MDEPRDLTPALEAARRRRQTLHDALVHLEQSISSPAAGRIPSGRRRSPRRWSSLRDAFEQHVIVTEKPGGLYEEIMERAPRLAGTLRRLHDEHPIIAPADRRRRSGGWRAAEVGGEDWPWINRARDDLQRFIGSIDPSPAVAAPTSSGRRTTSTSADRNSRSGAAVRLPVVVRIALGQLNTTVGDLDGNVARHGRVDVAGDRRRRRPDLLPGARHHRLSARGPRPAPGVRPGQPRCARRPRDATAERVHGARRVRRRSAAGLAQRGAVLQAARSPPATTR